MMSLWPLWLFGVGIVLVVAGWFTWAWRTREIAPSHSSPARRRQAARRSARAAQAQAWWRTTKTQGRRLVIWCGIKARWLTGECPQTPEQAMEKFRARADEIMSKRTER